MKSQILLFVAALCLLVNGCKITTAQVGSVRVVDMRLFTSSSGELSWPTTNGPITLKLSSTPATDAIKAAAEGAAAGARKF